MFYLQNFMRWGSLVKDPVCGMEIDPRRALEYEYKDKIYHFCSSNCESHFKQDPERFKNYDAMDPKLMQMKSSTNNEKKEKEIQIIQKKEDDKKMGKLKCPECGLEQELPKHCGRPMHKEGNQLVCWMGPSCGVQPIPKHHGKPMKVME